MEKKKFTADKIPVILAMACVVGIVFGVMFLREAYRDLAMASETPQVVPLPLLLKQGAGKNTHVTVTGLQVGQSYVTLTSHSARTFRTTTENAFYAVTPTVAKNGKPNFCLLADLSFNAEALQYDIPKGVQLTGFYQPQIPWGTLGTEATKLIRDRYPAIDLDHCAYLEIRPYHGTELAKDWQLVEWSAAGLVGCIVIIVWNERRARRQVAPAGWR